MGVLVGFVASPQAPSRVRFGPRIMRTRLADREHRQHARSAFGADGGARQTGRPRRCAAVPQGRGRWTGLQACDRSPRYAASLTSEAPACLDFGLSRLAARPRGDCLPVTWRLFASRCGGPSTSRSSVVPGIVGVSLRSRVRPATHHAFPQHPVELRRRHLIGLRMIEARRDAVPVGGAVSGLDPGPGAKSGECPAWESDSVVVASTVGAAARYVQPPVARISNTSVIGRWYAVFRFMCGVPRMSSMVRSTLTWLWGVLTMAPCPTYGPIT